MEHRNNLALELTKHIITICMATIGLVISGVATIFKEIYTFSDFAWTLLFFVFAIIFAVLTQASLISKSQWDRDAFGVIKDEHAIIASLACFLLGVALGVSTIL